jgi:hypothetical protein
LLANGALTLGNWPDYLAKPAETDAFWPYRITVHNYPAIGSKLPDLKVMLVFARYDHVQTATTKPHIRQAWDGFYRGADLWVRMNPDRAYVKSIDEGYDLAFPDNMANREPIDWIFIEDWGFPADHRVREDVWLASVAEMADRVYTDNWDDNLDSAFFPVLIDAEDTHVDNSSSPDLIPKTCRLLPNYPNPFNPKTTIPVRLSHPNHVTLTIYNLRGERVETLYEGKLPAGFYKFVWDASDIPSGMYLCRFELPCGNNTQKLILQK